MNLTQIGVINDLHIPFQDPIAYTILDAFEDQRVEHLIINGDLLDFYSINSYGKDVNVSLTVQSEIDQGIEFLEMVAKRFKKVTFLLGNHEKRLCKFISKELPAFHNYLTIDKMLRLEQLGIEWYDYQVPYKVMNSRLRLMHSPPSYGVSGARTSLLKKMDTSYIYACTHRVMHACLTGDSGTVYDCWFNGWLGSTDLTEDHRRVFAYMKGHQSWQHAAMLVTMIDGVDYYCEQLRPSNGKVLCNGNIYY